MATKSATKDKPAAEAAPKVSTVKACGCLIGTGERCPGTTRKSFTQGHDARMASRLAQEVANGKLTADQAEALIREAGGGELLVGKMRHSATLRATGGDSKKKAKTAGPKASADQALRVESSTSVLGTQVEVFHGQRKFTAVVINNASKDMVARHRLSGKDCDHEVAIEEGDEPGKPNIYTK